MTEERKHAVRRDKTPEQALASLMRLCARAEKSGGDAMRLMRQWGVDETRRQWVLDELTRQGFIDDERYAEAYVREKMRLSGWGSYKIAHMLAAKGIPRETVARVLAQYGGDGQKERLREALAKKIRTVRAADAYELKGKLMRYAMGLGYSYEDVVEAVEEAVRTHGAEEDI